MMTEDDIAETCLTCPSINVTVTSPFPPRH